MLFVFFPPLLLCHPSYSCFSHCPSFLTFPLRSTCALLSPSCPHPNSHDLSMLTYIVKRTEKIQLILESWNKIILVYLVRPHRFHLRRGKRLGTKEEDVVMTYGDKNMAALLVLDTEEKTASQRIQTTSQILLLRAQTVFFPDPWEERKPSWPFFFPVESSGAPDSWPTREYVRVALWHWVCGSCYSSSRKWIQPPRRLRFMGKWNPTLSLSSCGTVGQSLQYWFV